MENTALSNPILDSLYARKSVRAYTEQPILPEAREAILHAAMEAPTAGNQQLYTIIEVTDQAVKDQLAVSCDNQPFIAKAPMVLVFLADVQKWYDTFIEGGASPRKPGTGDLLLAVTDAVIAAQNCVTAAESLGIGSCYIGDILEQCEFHRQLFSLPDWVVPAAMLVFGYPTEQQKERRKPERCRINDIVMQNTYTRKDGEGLRRMFEKETRTRSFEDWSRAFCTRKYNSDFSIEMTRSVNEYLKAFKD